MLDVGHTVAERIATERGEQVGQSVGYQVRTRAPTPESDRVPTPLPIPVRSDWSPRAGPTAPS